MSKMYNPHVKDMAFLALTALPSQSTSLWGFKTLLKWTRQRPLTGHDGCLMDSASKHADGHDHDTI
jgi:hypothetical protein